jgi:DNA-binding GntR family transcriptional regulator
VHAILSGTHEPGSSHYDLLRAFASDATLRRASAELESSGYLTHEFGDSIFIEKRLVARLTRSAFDYARTDALAERWRTAVTRSLG